MGKTNISLDNFNNALNIKELMKSFPERRIEGKDLKSMGRT